MNGNEYDKAYPTQEEFELDTIVHIARVNDLKLTWKLAYALRDAFAEAKLALNNNK